MKSINAIVVLILLMVCNQLNSQTLEQDLQAIFDNYQLMGLSLAVDVQGTTESFHFGLRDFQRSLPVNEQTQFRIASISKAVTALAVIKLADQGEINLDDDISSYLPYTVVNPLFPGTPITFRMLLSHTSSLQDGGGYNNFLNATYTQNPIPNISELLIPGGAYYTSNMWRTESPGTYFAYSNINFGVLGTLIEAVSGERFDVYMKSEILEPIGITGSYNIQDVPDIDDIAVLYRNIGGWQPQFDNYQGVMPPPPDLSNYLPGTNGVYFAPQGGLRISALETNLFNKYLSSDGSSADIGISPAAIVEMKNIAWDYNGSNGDNYGGLFNRWGLGVHHSNINDGDRICSNFDYGTFIGHPGEAYGLISDGYFSNDVDVSFSLLINGIWNGYVVGTNTSYYTVEEDIFGALCQHFENTLNLSEFSEVSFDLLPNPTSEKVVIHLPQTAKLSLEIYDLLGVSVKKLNNVADGQILDVASLSAGIYLVAIRGVDTTKFIKLVKR